MLVSRAVKHTLSMFCTNEKYCFLRVNCALMVACSVRFNGVLSPACLANVGQTYTAALPGSFGRQNGLGVRRVYSSWAITIPFHP